MKHWCYDSVFYHIYPLGFCGGAKYNSFSSPAEFTLDKVYEWIDHFKYLGINAIYFGPVFESTSHGYDTVDYFNIDRRLGNNDSFARLVKYLHENGIKVIIDGVFNHTGRDFWAFYDLRHKLQSSKYKDWFTNINFGAKSKYDDPFNYEGWNGHYNLVKLNLKNPEVKKHLLDAVDSWIRNFNIDGIRLDTADLLDPVFLHELSEFCKNRKSDFWLMGEVIHGDYNKYACPGMIDSVTNYECYKGLYSSHADANYFEIAYSLNRQFGELGIYRNIPLYNFADNHDVNRVASSLSDKNHLFTLYTILFTMPGVPSIYYGSEWGIEGQKEDGKDDKLRPEIELQKMNAENRNPELTRHIARLSQIRKESNALKYGSYKQLYINHRQFAFVREYENETIVVAVNSANTAAFVNINVAGCKSGRGTNLLNNNELAVKNGNLSINNIEPYGSIIISI